MRNLFKRRPLPVVEVHRLRPCACGCTEKYCDIDLDAHDVWSDDLRDLQWYLPEHCPACKEQT